MSHARALILRYCIAVVIFGLGIGYYSYLVRTGPEPEQRPAIRSYPVVELMELQPSTYQVKLPSQGIIQPRTQTDLSAEVSGKVSRISPQFLNGAAFEKGEVLVQLDARNYETALARAEAELIRAQTAVTLAEAATEKAGQDWKRLGLRGSPTDLNLKIPQLREAEADFKAAEANVAEAQLNVERCTIVAPYSGRVVSQIVNVGQFVTTGTMLGQIYSSEVFEVRLPLRNDQLAFLNLERSDGRNPAVALFGESGSDSPRPAWIERTEAAVDSRSRQLFVIAAVDNSIEGSIPLPSGTFVQAQIEGELLEDVYVIPRSAIRGGDTILRVTPEEKVAFEILDVIYDGDAEMLIARVNETVKPGTKISLTPLPFVHDGDRITIKGEQSNRPEQRNQPGRPPLAQGPEKPVGPET